MTDNIRHLLGGYATGTLTPEENAALMEAALDDQELFDALADDEALRRYLADPAFRKDLLKATAPRPSRMPLIAGLFAAAASLSIGIFWMTHRNDNPPVTQVAVAHPPAVVPQIVATPAQNKPVVVKAKKQPAPLAKQPLEAKKEPEAATTAEAQPARAVATGRINTDTLSSVGGAAPPVLPAPPLPKSTAPAGEPPRAPAAIAPRRAISEALSRNALMAPRIVTGKITDVNATIITLDAGEKAGVKIGERLDVLHDNTNIGYVIITVTEPEYSVGKYTGEKTPAIGDTVATPKK